MQLPAPPTWAVVCGVVGWRVLNALVLRTFFVPDEYYQGAEVAYQLAFPETDWQPTWEWQAEHRVRSFLFPLFLALPTYLLDRAGLATRVAVIKAPMVLMALLAACGDLSTWRVAEAWFGPSVAGWTLALQVSNWFNAYCMVRTLSNGAEAALAAVALHCWTPVLLAVTRGGRPQKPRGHGGEWAALALAALSVAVRPTAAVLWAACGLYRLARCRSASDAAAFGGRCALVAAASLGMLALLDSYMYGRPTASLLNFLRFNVLEGRSGLFGGHPWHWYLSQGVPAVLLGTLPLFLLGAAQLWRGSDQRLPLQRLALILPAVYVALHSCVAHKEFRFLLPCLPFMHMVAAAGLRRARRRGHALGSNAALGGAVLLAHGMAFAFFSLYHQRGTIAIMGEVTSALGAGGGARAGAVDFLMPCHSAPAYSHLHLPGAGGVRARYLECSPLERAKGVRTESDAFEEDPAAFVEQRYRGREPPDALVIFDLHLAALEGARAPLLGRFRSRSCVPHASLNTDADRDGFFRRVCLLTRVQGRPPA